MASEESWKKGFESERRVREALAQMKRDGSIDDFKQTKRKSPEDHLGIDFIVYFHGVSIPLQVKSSRFHQLQHYQKHGYSIPCLVVETKNIIPALKRLIREHAWSLNNGPPPPEI
jgi:hypothetical protein